MNAQMEMGVEQAEARQRAADQTYRSIMSKQQPVARPQKVEIRGVGSKSPMPKGFELVYV